jgi:hypothetical protein
MSGPDQILGSRDFREFLRDRGRTITSRAREAGFFDHRQTLGVAREEVLLEPLREILPGRHGFTTGVIRSASGEVSGQWDVIIYDQANTPKLHQQGAAAVLPIETVQAVISVKSRADGPAVTDACKQLCRLRAMPRKEIPVTGMRSITEEPQPAGYLFGFEGVSLPNVRERLRARELSQPGDLLNGVCVHGRGVVVPVDAEGPKASVQRVDDYAIIESSDGSFGLFVAFLFVALTQVPMHSPDLVAYMNVPLMSGHIPEEAL